MNYATYKNDVILISCYLLHKYQSIINNLNLLSADGHPFTCCSLLECNNYIIVHFEFGMEEVDINNSTLEILDQLISEQKISITCYFNVYRQAETGILQIFDYSKMCNYKNKMLEAVISTEGNLWLGLVPYKETIEESLELYIKNGFRDPHITNVDTGGRALPFTVIGFYYKPSEPVLDTYKNGMVLYNEHFVVYDRLKVIYKFDKEVLEQLYSFTQKDREYGGVLDSRSECGSTFQFDDTQKRFYKQLQITKIESAEKPNDCTVNISPEKITFHSHPKVCYASTKTYVGWPSSNDMLILINEYTKRRKHYVITIEGIYSLELTQTFIMNLIPSELKIISELVRKEYVNWEGYRSVFTEPAEWYNNFIKFINFTNTFSVNDLLKKMDKPLLENDVLLFSLSFYDWDYVTYLNSLEDTTQNP